MAWCRKIGGAPSTSSSLPSYLFHVQNKKKTLIDRAHPKLCQLWQQPWPKPDQTTSCISVILLILLWYLLVKTDIAVPDWISDIRTFLIKYFTKCYLRKGHKQVDLAKMVTKNPYLEPKALLRSLQLFIKNRSPYADFSEKAKDCYTLNFRNTPFFGLYISFGNFELICM